MKVKNDVFGTLIFACTVVAFTSCSNETTCEAMSNEPATSNVIAELEKINSELLTSSPQTIKRAPAKPINWIPVVCADVWGAYRGGKRGGKIGRHVGSIFGSPLKGAIIGATLGGVTYGSYKSYKAWKPQCEIVSSNSPEFVQIKESCKNLVNEDGSINEHLIVALDSAVDKKIEVNEDLQNASGLDQQSLNIGKLHNIMLASLNNQIVVGDDPGIPAEPQSLKEEIYNSQEMNNGYDELLAGGDGDEGEGSDETLNKVMELFDQVLQEYATETDDVAFIIGKYMEVIDNTDDLTEEQKNSVKCGLATALYSANYWSLESELEAEK